MQKYINFCGSNLLPLPVLTEFLFGIRQILLNVRENLNALLLALFQLLAERVPLCLE